MISENNFNANKIDLIGSDAVGRISPLELLRRHNGHSRGVELCGVHDAADLRVSEELKGHQRAAVCIWASGP